MKSIRRHLTLTLVIGFTLLLSAGSLAIYFVTRSALLHEFDVSLRTRALTLIALAEQSEHRVKIEFPDEPRRQLEESMPSEFYELWLTDGTISDRSKSLRDANLPRHFGSLAEPVYWNLDLPAGFAGRAIGLTFSPRMEDEELGRGASLEAILVVAADRRSLDRTLTVLACVLLTTGLLTILLTLPMVKCSLRRGHAPLDRLARQAANITADSLKNRFPVDSMPEELLPITTRLNDLLGRLEASFQRERRFSADLAHELRTPLAELRAHAEVELEWGEKEEAEKHHETLGIAMQMEAIVTRLLEMTRCEDGKFPLQLEPVPLAALVEDAWRSHAASATRKDLVVSFNIHTNAVIHTDRTLFRSILTNLFSNAVEYTPQRGHVEIGWRSDSSELAVSNTVHDLTVDDVSHLFERLWRKDKSRTGCEHCGLGLSLSQAFAELLGLNLTATFSNETTLTLALRKRSQ
jgi:two-component system sensor histidine kinase QseC